MTKKKEESVLVPIKGGKEFVNPEGQPLGTPSIVDSLRKTEKNPESNVVERGQVKVDSSWPKSSGSDSEE